MRPVRALRLGLRALRNPEGERSDLADEVRSYLAEAEAELIARGVPPAEARRRVRLEHGEGLSTRDEVFTYGWEGAFRGFALDTRVAWRRLRRRPGFTAIAAVTLGLGIGASSAIFSAANPVLFRQLPYPDPDRLVEVAIVGPDGAPGMVAFGTYLEVAARDRSLEAVSVYRPWQPTLTGGDEPRRLEVQRVSAAYFGVLGVPPGLGRDFDPAEDRPGGLDVVVIGDRLWRERFGADPDVPGRTLELDGAPFTVIGVMPSWFENVTAPQAEAWVPLKYDPAPGGFQGREWGMHLGMIGRMGPVPDVEEARRALNALAAGPIDEFPRPPWVSLAQGLSVRPLKTAVTASERPAMIILLGAVGLLLLLACVNVSVLLLTHVSRRRGEFAMRTALGAGRGRLARQLLGESVLLALLGGALGLLVARAAIALITASSPASLLPSGGLELDRDAFLFALAVTLLVGLLAGMAPALTRFDGRAGEAARDVGRGVIGRRLITRWMLVTSQVALAVVLLIGSGLLIRTTHRLFSIPPGFDPSGVAVLQVSATGRDGGDADTNGFFQLALERVGSVPGVSAAAFTSQLPLSGDADIYGVSADGEGDGTTGSVEAYRYAVSPGYFETMGIRRVAGRTFGSGDRAGAERVAVVSEALARSLFRGDDPMGRRIRVSLPERPPFTVVGVVENVKQESLGTETLEAVYMPADQWHWADPVRWIVARTGVAADPTALVPAIRRGIWSVDPNQPIARTQAFEILVERSEARRRFVLEVLRAFALLALTLAAVGLFGVLSENVTSRRRELGVRAALGASGARIRRLVLRQGLTMTAVGVALGVLAGAAVTGVLTSLLFDVSRLDPLTYGGVVALVCAVAIAACWAPALRASRADPMEALSLD